MNETVIKVKDVVKDYAAKRALDHVSMEVERGKIHGLLGPNGAGKTTLIRILNRITAPDEGEITFLDRTFTRKDLDRIGYLPEERGLYPKMKVGDQAMYLSRLKGLSSAEAKKRLEEWFERMDILPWWNKEVRELSKGMAQKVQFICTVIHKPDLLIFDEPFSGFDPLNVEIIKREILRMKDEGATLIFSTHSMQSVEDLCDNLTLINRGKVVLGGSVKLIRQGYKGNLYKITFDSDIPFPEEKKERYTLKSRDEDPTLGYTSFLIENDLNLAPNDILSEWMGYGNIVLFEETIPSMNEIFIDVVKKSGVPEELQGVLGDGSEPLSAQMSDLY